MIATEEVESHLEKLTADVQNLKTIVLMLRARRIESLDGVSDDGITRGISLIEQYAARITQAVSDGDFTRNSVT